jgi:hypothetical protein
MKACTFLISSSLQQQHGAQTAQHPRRHFLKPALPCCVSYCAGHQPVWYAHALCHSNRKKHRSMAGREAGHAVSRCMTRRSNCCKARGRDKRRGVPLTHCSIMLRSAVPTLWGLPHILAARNPGRMWVLEQWRTALLHPQPLANSQQDLGTSNNKEAPKDSVCLSPVRAKHQVAVGEPVYSSSRRRSICCVLVHSLVCLQWHPADSNRDAEGAGKQTQGGSGVQHKSSSLHKPRTRQQHSQQLHKLPLVAPGHGTTLSSSTP